LKKFGRNKSPVPKCPHFQNQSLNVIDRNSENAKRLSGAVFAIHAGKKNRCKAPVIRESYTLEMARVSPIQLLAKTIYPRRKNHYID